ncbi:MAG: hypothetical protein QNJ60_11450 [Xenococcaceae cyanobacterium MO_188.B19]|nr:hypothetical protein [Xenococcaceae cyanobacterium MO_188.B19]
MVKTQKYSLSQQKKCLTPPTHPKLLVAFLESHPPRNSVDKSPLQEIDECWKTANLEEFYTKSNEETDPPTILRI